MIHIPVKIGKNIDKDIKNLTPWKRNRYSWCDKYDICWCDTKRDSENKVLNQCIKFKDVWI